MSEQLKSILKYNRVVVAWMMAEQPALIRRAVIAHDCQEQILKDYFAHNIDANENRRREYIQAAETIATILTLRRYLFEAAEGLELNGHPAHVIGYQTDSAMVINQPVTAGVGKLEVEYAWRTAGRIAVTTGRFAA